MKPDPGHDHDSDYQFCHHDPRREIFEELNPYDEDGYCCWCGNGSWKFHMWACRWADIHDPE